MANAKWISESKAFLRESKIDLEAARLLKCSDFAGIERRRLYLLQQALEKGVKSSLPVMLVGFRGSSRMGAYRMEFEEQDGVDQTALAVLRARIEQFARRIAGAKDLGHYPAERLQLKMFTEDLYLYVRLMQVPEQETASVREAVESFKEKRVSEVLSRIDDAERERVALADKSIQRLEREKSKVGSMAEVIQVADEVIFPNFMSYLSEVILYVSLASHLARYEQACRYPGQGTIPKEVINSLDIIEGHIKRFVRWMDEFFGNAALLSVMDQMYFKSRSSVPA